MKASRFFLDEWVGIAEGEYLGAGGGDGMRLRRVNTRAVDGSRPMLGFAAAATSSSRSEEGNGEAALGGWLVVF
jgi:hypothetical protein